ncbi:MAG: hypothetical protein ACOY3H_04750 [Bacillota bacterium]|uniref:Uncharacterized protein n=2 Tax=Carboxydocella TaxID=178898 RepID=A0A1T4RZB8_9FIRM|nr:MULTISPECIES: hypothetical protein [Carboxydocella]AVX21398.1 hypothetical protein CFE_2255 [Carboxydocella thermautotrophica]AVX31887.1 hypothetical protein CTH_2348 [Carboxydocella thermautotrophica]SKA20901.1 hypothetical protein SAMN02745885_02335 [Carboxydocella sporoproducens DSM 16521]GAW28478.1 hypothetical protein ULO1_10480 [Carboxydocella sp. ULO1]GAW32384.1 hypothetical protein JDF658_21490 [Carboxydocella sp. JDF658]
MSKVDPQWLSVSLPRERLCQLLTIIEMQIKDLEKAGVKPSKLLVDRTTYMQLCAYAALQNQAAPVQYYNGLELIIGPNPLEVPCVLADAPVEYWLWKRED